MNKYIWENFDNSKLNELRVIFHLEQVVKSGRNEFEKQIILKNWLSKALPNGSPCDDYSNKSAIEILRDAKEGKQFWCTQFALAYVQCATALGWYSRKLAIDCDHKKGQEDRHHGIADIWSNDFNKWYAVDAQNNMHFVKNGTPLNALEIRFEFLKNSAKDIKGIDGNDEKEIEFKKNDTGFGTPSNYFWFFISQRNNFFEEPGIYNSKAYLFVDENNKGKIWYMTNNENSVPHPMYGWSFIKTKDTSICFPAMH